jgi:hypothetical protein
MLFYCVSQKFNFENPRTVFVVCVNEPLRASFEVFRCKHSRVNMCHVTFEIFFQSTSKSVGKKGEYACVYTCHRGIRFKKFVNLLKFGDHCSWESV